jgi:hypothetical protein
MWRCSIKRFDILLRPGAMAINYPTSLELKSKKSSKKVRNLMIPFNSKIYSRLSLIKEYPTKAHLLSLEFY